MTPPPAVSVAESMRPVAAPTDSQINRDLLSVMEGISLGWLTLLGACLLVMGAAGATWIYQVYAGLGIAGYTHPVFWGVYIVTFVFWVGIAHAGTLISAILFLFRAKWRNAINRGAEAMTVFAVLTAAQFLGIHVGRIWVAYWLAPVPNQMGVWPNFPSPLPWDVFAVSIYGTVSLLFCYVGLIPDLATPRDRSKTTGKQWIFGAFAQSLRWTVKERSVMPPWPTFCTMTSTSILASAIGPRIAYATPGRSGTSCTVILASSRLNATPEITAFSIAMWGSSSNVTSVPERASSATGSSGSVRLESTRVGTRTLPANSTERICSTLEPAPAISSISSNVMVRRRRASGTTRGSVVYTPSTSV